MSTFSQSTMEGHAIALCCIQTSPNRIVLEFFDSNGLLEPFRAKSDMFWVSLFNGIIHKFKERGIDCNFVEVNTKHINPYNNCNSWNLYFFYTRLAFSSMNTKDYFSFVHMWYPELIKHVNKFLTRKIGKNTFNMSIIDLNSSKNNKANIYKKLERLNKHYMKYTYNNFRSKTVPTSVNVQVKAITKVK